METDTIPRWRVFTSDKGRLWATREQPFDRNAMYEGAARTVDGDDEIALARAIAEQENTADLAARPSR